MARTWDVSGFRRDVERHTLGSSLNQRGKVLKRQ